MQRSGCQGPGCCGATELRRARWGARVFLAAAWRRTQPVAPVHRCTGSRHAPGSDTLAHMAIRTELNLRVPNSPGTLAAICRLLADERVNITALALDTSGQLRLVVDNAVRAAGILRARHYQVAERNVVLVPVANGPGALAPVLTLAAESGVNIEYAYAAAAEGSATAAVVMGVT